jgi:hypothetical protein
MEIQRYRESAVELQTIVDTAIVKSEEDVANATDIAKRIREVRLKVEAEKKEYEKPAKEIIAKAKSVYDPVINTLKTIEDKIKDKSAEYIIAERQRVREAQAKVEKKLEEGKMKDTTAVRKMEEIGEEKKSIRGEMGQMRVTEYKDVEIYDETLLPREYLVPDTQKIKKLVLAGVEIAGAKIVIKNKTSLY